MLNNIEHTVTQIYNYSLVNSKRVIRKEQKKTNSKKCGKHVSNKIDFVN